MDRLNAAREQLEKLNSLLGDVDLILNEFDGWDALSDDEQMEIQSATTHNDKAWCAVSNARKSVRKRERKRRQQNIEEFAQKFVGK